MKGGPVTGDDFLSVLAGLRRARVGGGRAPHKPLFLLWLFGRFLDLGSSAVSYDEAEEPVSRLINDFGPAVANAKAARERAAMPFVHLERDLWDLQDQYGHPLPLNTSERGNHLRSLGAHGRLNEHVERLLADPRNLAAAARLLLDQHFTPTLEEPICAAAGLDHATLSAGPAAIATPKARKRRAGFPEEVLRAYAYSCAMCGFDGALGRNPVGIQAAHVRWHSEDGPDEVHNGLALCSLHHVLFDLGVIGLLPDLRIQVSELYVARNRAGRALDDLHGQPLATPQRGRPSVDPAFVDWHVREVFKRPGTKTA